MAMDPGLKGKVAVVTGSSRGLGEAAARLLAKEGVKVIVNGTAADDVKRVAKEIKAAGGEATPVVESVADWQGCGRLIKAAVDTYGQLNIMVNNAGRIPKCTLLDMTEEIYDRQVDLQLKGVFACTHFAVKQMVKQGKGGRIINVAGASGQRGMIAASHHSATKGGVIAATLSWAQELESYGITVNQIRGAFRSATSKPYMEEAQQRYVEMGRPKPTSRDLGLYEPEEVAVVMVWLASEQAKDINGQYFGCEGAKAVLWGYTKPLKTVYHFPVWTPETLETIFRPAVQDSFENIAGNQDIVPFLKFSSVARP